eukprot:5561448-Pyramimonas_sp.AAC.1
MFSIAHGRLRLHTKITAHASLGRTAETVRDIATLIYKFIIGYPPVVEALNAGVFLPTSFVDRLSVFLPLKPSGGERRSNRLTVLSISCLCLPAYRCMRLSAHVLPQKHCNACRVETRGALTMNTPTNDRANLRQHGVGRPQYQDIAESFAREHGVAGS